MVDDADLFRPSIRFAKRSVWRVDDTMGARGLTTRWPRTVELLHWLLIASVALPILLVTLLALFTYKGAFSDATDELIWTSEIAREHAAKVFDSYRLVADRVDDLLHPLDEASIRAQESELSHKFKTIVAGLPQIESLIVLDRRGHLLVATETDHADRTLDFSDRDYFRALQSGAASFVSKIQTSRVSGKTFFGWGLPRRDASGAFDGVISIAVSPLFLQNFYATFASEIGESIDGRVVTIVRDDGQVLVRFPALAGETPVIPADNPLFTAIHANPGSGTYVSRSLVEAGNRHRLFAYRKVPDQPVYVVSGRSVRAIQLEWAAKMVRYLALVVPGAVALFLVALAALRGARREGEALALAQAEMRRRETVEGQLRQSQKMEAVGKLTGGIAHDFNNLLTVIQSSVDLLRRPDLTADRQARYLTAISETTERATRLTGQLLAFARRQALKPEVFDAAAEISSILNMLRTLIGPRISLETRLTGTDLFINVDQSQFDTTIVNLVANARDAMRREGHLTIVVHAVEELPPLRGSPAIPGHHVAVAIKDTGVGIAPDHLDAIFEPFFTTKRKGEGTGLGLSQVFGFVKQSGGEIAVESELGRGTGFTLYLPRVGAPRRAAAEAESPVHTSDAASYPTRVLVVEDDIEVGASAIEAMTALGCGSVLATTAEAALAELDRDAERFDVIFSDVVMPGMSGIEFGREVRRRYPDLPVVLTSGYSDVLAESGDHGFELLHKPYHIDHLAQAIRAAAHWRQRRRTPEATPS